MISTGKISKITNATLGKFLKNTILIVPGTMDGSLSSNAIAVAENDVIISPATLKILTTLAGDLTLQQKSCAQEKLRKSNLADEVTAAQEVLKDSGKILIDLLTAMKNDLGGKWSLLSDVSLESPESLTAREVFEEYVNDLPDNTSTTQKTERRDKYDAYTLALARHKLNLLEKIGTDPKSKVCCQLHDRFTVAAGIPSSRDNRIKRDNARKTRDRDKKYIALIGVDVAGIQELIDDANDMMETSVTYHTCDNALSGVEALRAIHAQK